MSNCNDTNVVEGIARNAEAVLYIVFSRGDAIALCDLNIPVVSNLPFGHEAPNAALAVGVIATLDA